MNLHLTPVEMLAGLGGLVVLVVAWRVSVRATRRVVDTARAGARLVSLAGRVLVTAAVLVAVQWVVLTHAAGNTTLVASALGAPDLLAGYALTRALTVTTFDAPRRRGGRR
ncbi:MAG TPA: hypothetical protein VFW65_38785 [Pseudonocardiaceae bacterium]|nr:hypothetical protein [Pseudonocardiaceae bacterium]